MNRRELLKNALVIGFGLCPGVRGAASGEFFRPNAWLRISEDNRITILVEKPELGQGSRTYTAMMIAEELEADWATIRVEQAPTEVAIYHGLRTGASGGVQSTFFDMRRAGVQAREMLLSAAALEWHVRRAECRAENGAILHSPTNRRLSYGQLVKTAALLPPLNINEMPLKPPAKFRFIGKPIPRLDIPEKVDGSARFGIDVRIPGMFFAMVVRCPFFGGRLIDYDASSAKQVPGVCAVFPIPPLPRRFNTAGGIAVVAESTWAALQGRKALATIWEKGPAASETIEGLRRQAAERATGPPSFIAVDRGNALDALATAVRKVEAVYESPFQAHATMEPMNTTVHVREGEIEVWSPTQFADEVQREIAELSGLAQEKVNVHVMLAGGSFGRRYQWDYAAEAWQIAKEVRQPVQLLWTREDDIQHDFYRQYNYQHLTTGFDAAGKVAGWHARVLTTPISSSNLYTGFVESRETLKDPATIAALEWYGADVAPYAIGNVRVEYSPLDFAAPRSWWRSVASSYTIFARECFIDETAHTQGRDPLAFRMELLKDEAEETERLRNVLRLAAEQAEWERALPAGFGRGIACCRAGSVSAQVAQVAVDAAGRVRVQRVVAVVDCGIAVNPDGVKAMTEGAINFALSAVLKTQITIRGGRVQESNFHDFPVLRIDEAPDIEVHIISSEREPSGVGELGAMLIPAAVCNAVFAARGIRVRHLPIAAGPLRRAKG